MKLRAVAAVGLALLPPALPGWMNAKTNYEVFYRRAPYNFAIYNVPALAADFNGTSVGHAMAYEDLVTGKAATLETKTFARIDRVLKNPPRLAPTERSLSPTFSRRFGLLEQVFDWTHTLHFQTIDVLANDRMTLAQKDAEIERLYRNYRTSVPFAITPLPMNMSYLYGQPYSRRFRDRYPKVNGLFWGYHWLQTSVYDMLYAKTRTEQRRAYAMIGDRYRTLELYKTDREFMPMMGETSPRFSARFPEIANVFDNLHMLHDMVNDILVSPDLSDAQKDEQVQQAIWMVMEQAHAGEKAGVVAKGGEGKWHDHRHMDGMPGMGLMPGATPQVMFMPIAGMGWMSLSECHHCSMPLPTGPDSWRMSTVSAQGVTMMARCALCARDYSAETQGSALLHIATEDPARPVIILSDDKGEIWSQNTDAVFLEREGSHVGCSEWSQAFTSRAAFDRFVAANPTYRGATALSLKEWWEREGKKPDTYAKPQAPTK